jgi:hypothetical protein
MMLGVDMSGVVEFGGIGIDVGALTLLMGVRSPPDDPSETWRVCGGGVSTLVTVIPGTTRGSSPLSPEELEMAGV